ncbi:hypothetical protein ACWIG3_23320 [Streptomyces celluloflavus]|uniref:hypothetical protein n=1 Tax=Streptomyces TaxID=1883 RepID=UPI000B9DFE7C|nr:hypothetical protein [Streptomyces kasugaensis]
MPTTRDPAHTPALARVPAAREPFRVGAAVVDTHHSKVGEVEAVRGECLVLSRSVGDPWDALAAWCRPATRREALSLTALQGTDGAEGSEGHP